MRIFGDSSTVMTDRMQTRGRADAFLLVLIPICIYEYMDIRISRQGRMYPDCIQGVYTSSYRQRLLPDALLP